MKTHYVQSHSDPKVAYKVEYYPEGDKFVCKCKDYKHRSYRFDKYECRHIKEVKGDLKK